MFFALFVFLTSLQVQAARIVPQSTLTVPLYDFPSCTKAYQANQNSTSNPDWATCYLHSGVSKGVRDVNSRLQENLDIAAVAQLIRPKIDQMINRSLDARIKLVDCFAADSVDCKSRIETLLKDLNHQVKVLRVAMSLSLSRPFGLPSQRGQINPLVHYPEYMGRPTMPRLDRDEIKFAERSRDRIKDYLSRADEFKALRSTETEKRCTGNFTEECRKYRLDQLKMWFQLQTESQKVVLRLIEENPLVTRFSKAPITREALKAALISSRDALKDWKQEVAGQVSDEDLIFAYPRVANEILKDNSKFCTSVQKGFQRTSTAKTVEKYAKTGLEIAGTLGVCLVTDGLGCAATGFGVSGFNTKQAYDDHRITSDRYFAQGKAESSEQADLDENVTTGRKLIKITDVENSHRDYLINFAFGALAGAPLVSKVASGVALKRGASTLMDTYESGAVLAGSEAEGILPNAVNQVSTNTSQEVLSQSTRNLSGVPNPGDKAFAIYTYLKYAIPY